ncbi:MAG: hypothetical protein HC939_20705 [Pleurocapsa sp. SU_5_0]|nr:hypothetical protein [Pleurocapsa sp. SU_5_0]
MILLVGIEPNPATTKNLYYMTRVFLANLASGKASIARMLIDKDESPLLNAEGEALTEAWVELVSAVKGASSNAN